MFDIRGLFFVRPSFNFLESNATLFDLSFSIVITTGERKQSFCVFGTFSKCPDLLFCLFLFRLSFVNGMELA